MNRYGVKLLMALLLGYGAREFVEWLGYSSRVGTLAGLATIVAFYGVDHLIMRKRLYKP